MTATAASRDDGPTEAGPPPSVTARAYFRLARGFWQGPTRLQAWRLTAGVLVFVLANLAAALGINRWNRYFFDALEKRDVGSVFWGIGVVAALVIFSAVATAGLLHMRMHLQLRWREWLTEHLIRRWLSDRRFYQLTIVAGGSENPEYRIADDVRLAVEPLVEFLIGLSNALLAAIAFIGVLWSVGGSLTIGTVTIPGYMVFAAIAYSALTSVAIVVLGRAADPTMSRRRTPARRGCATSSPACATAPRTSPSSAATTTSASGSRRPSARSRDAGSM